MKRVILYLGLLVFFSINKFPPSLADKAEHHHILWNPSLKIPTAILGKNFYLEPCSDDDPRHQNLFQNIFTDSETMKYFGYGEVKTPTEALERLKHYSMPWKHGRLTGGFVVIQDQKAVMLVGIGLFQAAGVGEFFIIADPSVRGKGLATEVMKVLNRWVNFLRASKVNFINYTNGKKGRLHTIFATASEDNIPSIRLLLNHGFQPITSLSMYKMGFPKHAQLFFPFYEIKGLNNKPLSIIYPTRYMKRKAGFERKLLHIRP